MIVFFTFRSFTYSQDCWSLLIVYYCSLIAMILPSIFKQLTQSCTFWIRQFQYLHSWVRVESSVCLFTSDECHQASCLFMCLLIFYFEVIS